MIVMMWMMVVRMRGTGIENCFLSARSMPGTKGILLTLLEVHGLLCAFFFC